LKAYAGTAEHATRRGTPENLKIVVQKLSEC
jgi:hypothetical protein